MLPSSASASAPPYLVLDTTLGSGHVQQAASDVELSLTELTDNKQGKTDLKDVRKYGHCIKSSPEI